ncbi:MULTISPECIES: glycosyltransferase [Nitrosomonas]|uniref:Glycosyl transferase family 4 n=2 Tax=Nitrosomonas eutropha TaxID=916 RepID=A0ABX5M9C6_9PROT|nr:MULTISPECIES: glycosyltransferase [Nitrosomonas]MXS80464.1 glycosyltransferase [Nitrosomonas sp. GH22]PXV83732.1 glycosyl transferase family 4 [Nitrosomonas eutropha]SCX17146.1 Glycosyl transferase 4-like domain-containing protein [Nitrosomonas eutropha]SDW52624.1 Glycosyl transferase 4-like domain-containing protein [Nitrosomonas eutropha]SEI53813.1 Glycosyl transferase 4-like domain-containing protein [Nitrosomonas eutropha]
MVKRVLMIAYHFPPLHGSSGMQRTLRFARYLPDHGWEPIVLTPSPRAYQQTDSGQLADIPQEVRVYRAFALDTARHLTLKGRYPRLLALPDRWISWWLGAVPTGWYLIKKYKPDVIWSTYPIATAHLIGLTLHRLTGIPWVADFRDPMVQPDYPPDPLTYRAYERVENKTIAQCASAVFTTPGTLRDYQTRFSHVPASRFHLIENGYDESSFAAITRSVNQITKAGGITLLHSGVIYPSERDPTCLFEALATLLKKHVIGAESLHIILRASHHEAYLQSLIDHFEIGAVVSLAPPISYNDALAEMLTVDGLLILQAANCNNQIPAKLYEYLRAQRPILALTDLVGDTAEKLRSMGVDTIAPLDSKEAIMTGLRRFLALLREDKAPIAPMDKILSNSREARTKELARLLGAACKG